MLPYLTRIIFAICISTTILVAWGLEDLKALQKNHVKGSWKQEKQIQGLGILKSDGVFELRDKTLYWTIESPIQSEIKIDKDGIWNKMQDSWVKGNENYDKSIFLDIINLDFTRLKEHFDIQQSGSESAWKLTLTPSNVWLGKVFECIEITGSLFIETISLYERSGDTTHNTFYNAS